MRRLLLLAALIWMPFVLIFVFAAQGDTSFWHISFHLVALALMGWACVIVWAERRDAAHKVRRVLAGSLSIVVPLAVVGHLLELAAALVRLAEDGWVNRDTADLWERGLHLWASNLTIPAMMVSMIVVLVLVVVTAVQERRGVLTPT